MYTVHRMMAGPYPTHCKTNLYNTVQIAVAMDAVHKTGLKGPTVISKTSFVRPDFEMRAI